MSLFRHAAREYLIHRLSRDRHRYAQRRRPYGYGYGRHRPRHPFILGRPRRRTRVHVGGCCLPIPLGVLLVSTGTARALIRRHRR
jgi:hypothetical protein